MSHARWEQQIGPLLDGELPSAEAARVREHVETCGDCRARLDQIRQLSHSIQLLPREPMPVDLKADILGAQARRGQPAMRPAWSRPWAVASLASAALVVVVAVVTTLRQGEGTPAPVLIGRVTTQMDSTLKESTGAPPSRARPAEAPGMDKSDKSDTGNTGDAGDADAAHEADSALDALTRRKDTPQATPRKIARQELGKQSLPVEESKKKLNAAESLPVRESEMAAQGAVVARYTTLLVLSEGQDPFLSRIVAEGMPATASGDSGALAPQARTAPSSAPAAGLAAPESLGDQNRSATRGDSALSLRALAQRRGPAATLTYLASIAPDGRILSAQLIGARTESVEVIDAVGALLQGGQVASPAERPARTMTAAIEVRLPAAPGN
ncbi:MAG TPA: anti-sigma factor [Patescibacteria group bacterium]|nr:anti-sigma factor [Patescibacteria group bacterium]